MGEHVRAIFVVNSIEAEELCERCHSIGRDPPHACRNVVHEKSPDDIVVIANSLRKDISGR